VDENNTNILYYHKDLNVLINKFNDRLNQLRIEEIDSIPLASKNNSCIKTFRSKMQRHPPNNLLPSLI
jgi:hypothetical protein